MIEGRPVRPPRGLVHFFEVLAVLATMYLLLWVDAESCTTESSCTRDVCPAVCTRPAKDVGALALALIVLAPVGLLLAKTRVWWIRYSWLLAALVYFFVVVR
jgi:hypothetical protein